VQIITPRMQKFKGSLDLQADFFLAALGAELLALSWTPLFGATCKIASTIVKAFLPSLSLLPFSLNYIIISVNYAS
jgi:hypothetical protein